MRSLTRCLLGIIAYFFVINAGYGAEQAADEAKLRQAESAYDQGHYQDAIAIYEGMIKEGAEHGLLFYNLGNAYYRLGQKGKAMAAYLGARKLLPRNPEIKANLTFVHEQGSDSLAVASPATLGSVLTFWNQTLTLRELFYAALSTLAVAFFILTVSLLAMKPVLRPVGLVALGLAGLLVFVFTISSVQEENWGAVTSASASVRSGPGALNTVLFELHEGAPFMATGQENGWRKILLSDGKVGWVEGSTVAVLP